jgi:hypothetical protein
MDHSQLTLADLLDDPITIAVMAADRVDPVALEAVLSALARKLGVARGTGHRQIGFGCYHQSPCHLDSRADRQIR